MTIEEVKRALHLVPHPAEGGFFAETYRSTDSFSDPRYPGPRSLSTAIYYLLTPGTFSALHRLPTDEIFHFYLGDPAEMLQLHPDGSARRLVLGTNVEAGMRPQIVVPRGVWQGTRLLAHGEFALLGTTMAPGFEYEDYEAGTAALADAYPEERERILSLLH